ncbi:MAG: DUF669 domain-containing protein [Acholeplasmataceae bacterium]
MSEDILKMKLNLGDVSTSPQPIGPGYFTVEVSTCEPKLGKQKGTPYLSWELTVVEEQYAGRKLFFNTGLTERSVWTLKRALEALGFERDSIESDELDVEEVVSSVIGMQAIAEVELREYNGTERDNVTKLLPLGSNVDSIL